MNIDTERCLSILREEIQLCGSDPAYCSCDKVHCNDELERSLKSAAQRITNRPPLIEQLVSGELIERIIG